MGNTSNRSTHHTEADPQQNLLLVLFLGEEVAAELVGQDLTDAGCQGGPDHVKVTLVLYKSKVKVSQVKKTDKGRQVPKNIYMYT